MQAVHTILDVSTWLVPCGPLLQEKDDIEMVSDEPPKVVIQAVKEHVSTSLW